MEKKKYFIGWMPTNSQSELLGCITLEISRRFSLKDVSKTHPFHLTAKVPFLATEEEIVLVSKTLNAFTRGLSKFSLQMDGYGHFGNTVIYADIIPDFQMGRFLSIQKRLYESLFMHNAWMSFDRFEPLVLPHITLVKDDVDVKCSAVFEYLWANHRIDFMFTVEELCLFEKKDELWVVNEKFKFH